MGTQYVTTPVIGYNTTPPSDDGAKTDANRVRWSTVKSKLGDPLKTALATMDTALVAALDTGAVARSAAYTTTPADNGKTLECSGTFTLSLGDAASMPAGYTVNALNIGTGLVTLSRITAADTLNGFTADRLLRPKASITVRLNAAKNGYIAIADSEAGSFDSVNGIIYMPLGTDLTYVRIFAAPVSNATPGTFNAFVFPLTLRTFLGASISVFRPDGTPAIAVLGAAFAGQMPFACDRPSTQVQIIIDGIV